MRFQDGDQFDSHIRNNHTELDTESDIAQFREWCEIKLPRLPHLCPICNCIPEKIAVVKDSLLKSPNVTGPGDARMNSIEFQQELINHIGSHLKELGMMSIEYLDENENGSNASKQHEVSSGTNRDRLMLVDQTDALDPQYGDYMSPSGPPPLDIVVDWSRVKDFSISKQVSFWSRAYEALGRTYPSLVDSYEKLLSTELQDESQFATELYLPNATNYSSHCWQDRIPKHLVPR